MPVQTNIVVADLVDSAKRDEMIQRLAAVNIKVSAFGPGKIRLVTHLDITAEMMAYTLEKIKSC
jgi:threonine aldolase